MSSKNMSTKQKQKRFRKLCREILGEEEEIHTNVVNFKNDYILVTEQYTAICSDGLSLQITEFFFVAYGEDGEISEKFRVCSNESLLEGKDFYIKKNL
jgi:hypothetical protein